MINVLLNTHSLLDYHRTGIPYYTLHLFNGMKYHQDIASLYAFTDHRLVKYSPSRNCNPLTGLDTFYNFLESKSFLKNMISKMNSQTFESFVKTKYAKDAIYFEPNFIMKSFEGSCITTLHDLTCLRFPELQPAKTVTWFETGLQQTLKQAKHIISVSNFTRNEAIRYLGISPEKITTVHNGVSEDFRPRSKIEIHPLLTKYNLSYKNYFLSVSTLEPRKNLSNLLQGYLQLPLAYRQQYPLVLVGAVGWKIQELLTTLKHSEASNVRLLGYVPQADLAPLFSGARAFCYLSTYEGFGLPVLEALASGLPVLTSIDSAMAEFSHQHALLVNPLNSEAISQGLQQLLENEALEHLALSAADDYRDKFAWGRCVAETIAVIKERG